MRKLLISLLLAMVAGCSWQGQRQYENKEVVAEWWSMRLFWVSSGIEVYNETPYWTAGYSAAQSKNDPNAVELAVEVVKLVNTGIIP